MINQKNLQKLKKSNQEKGGVNMCKAIEDMIEDGRIEGKLEGKFDERINGIRRQRKKGMPRRRLPIMSVWKRIP